jgi:hypothetical protein
MFAHALRILREFWNRALEVEVRYTSVPVWTPWRDFMFTNNEESQSLR